MWDGRGTVLFSVDGFVATGFRVMGTATVVWGLSEIWD